MTVYYPGTGINAETGKILTGWGHLKQSLGKIFTTEYGERIMLEWFGSAVPRLLGENMVPSAILASFSAIAMAVDLWEPRAKVTKVFPIKVDRVGNAVFFLDVEYRPRGHLGDFTPVTIKRVSAYGAPARVWRVEDA